MFASKRGLAALIATVLVLTTLVFTPTAEGQFTTVRFSRDFDAAEAQAAGIPCTPNGTISDSSRPEVNKSYCRPVGWAPFSGISLCRQVSDNFDIEYGYSPSLDRCFVASYNANATSCQAPAVLVSDAIVARTGAAIPTARCFLYMLAPVCAGQTVTIDMNIAGTSGTGTPATDVILGTAGNDVINGGGGKDIICGLAGDDTINGGDANDYIYGGPGIDTINGGFGIDYIYGEDGADILNGEGGSDRMYGGPGGDEMLGASGADRMFGGPGDDEMRGMGGQDFMWGEDGNDTMQGNWQSDNLFGGPGNDDLFGAGGKDTLFGGPGSDDLFGGLNTDYLNGGTGTDTANGGRGRDKPLIAPTVRAGNGQYVNGSGCVAETILNCQPTP